MQTNKIKRYTNFVFLALILIPVLQWRVFHFNQPSLDENRGKESIPPKKEMLSFLSTDPVYSKHFEDYFNDHYGFRDFLIMFQHQIDYSLFGWSQKITLGNNDYLLYRSVLEVEQIFNERYPDAAFEKLERRLLSLNQWTKSHGMTLVLLPMPLKNTTFPELLPKGAPIRPEPTRFEKLVNFLEAHGEVQHLNVLSILRSADKKYPVYYKNDFHWNIYGAAQIAPKLVAQLAKVQKIKDPWSQNLIFETKKFSDGGQSKSLSILKPLVEEAPFLTSDLRPSWESYKTEPKNANDWTYTNPRKDAAELGPLTVFGDSYEDGLSRTGYHTYFKSVRKFYINSFKEGFDQIPAESKFLVLEFIEPVIRQMMDDSFWPAELQNE